LEVKALKMEVDIKPSIKEYLKELSISVVQVAFFQFNHKNLHDWIFLITGLALIVGLALTAVSWMEVCSAACVEGHKYRLFGYKFEFFGLLFFCAATFCHILSRFIPIFSTVTALLVAGAVGSEIYFLYVQKVIIGQWCPVCISIAASVFFAAAALMTPFIIDLKTALHKGKFMNTLVRALPPVSTMFLSFFLVAFIGVAKINPLQAKQDALREKIAFGKKDTAIEIYIFTDWFCTACRQAEPTIERMAPALEKEGTLYIIDAGFHQESLNFTPFNLSFMIYNKDKYFQLRQKLSDLARRTEEPTDDEVQEIIAPLNVELKELTFSEVNLGVKLFKKLRKQFGVNVTPTVVVVNRDTKKGKKLKGTQEITESNVLQAINSLK